MPGTVHRPLELADPSAIGTDALGWPLQIVRLWWSFHSDHNGHMARLSQLVVDSCEPSSLARFWAAALDDFVLRAYDDEEVARLASSGRTPETDPCVILDGPTLEICFQEAEVLATPKRPMHVDIETPHRVDEQSRLVSLGASIVQEFATHTWMRDPEGNDFCLADT